MYKLLSHNELHQSNLISCAWGIAESVPNSANLPRLGGSGKQAQPQCSRAIQGVCASCLEGNKTMIILCPLPGEMLEFSNIR